MNVKIERPGKPIETDYLVVFIGEDKYRIEETNEGKLSINKSSDSSEECIRVYPRYANVIDIN